MSQDAPKRIGLLIGSEWDLPDALINTINAHPANVTAELVKIGGTFIDDTCPYNLIIDRTSHDIPYYRAYVKFAAAQGTFIINNPFTWSADSKFFGAALVRQLGLKCPKTVALPNKHISKETTVDSYRNLVYPLDWDGIIQYVGMPAILKDIISGGRPAVHRVHNEDELMQFYDESGTRTMILQQLVESDIHIHGFVFGQEKALLLRYSRQEDRYLPNALTADDPLFATLEQASVNLTRVYRYNVNMVEFVIQGDDVYVINSTNPVPVMDKSLMSTEQFDRIVQEFAEIAISRALKPRPQRAIIGFTND